MFRPAARRVRKTDSRLNLVPILDAVFIFIFFLLASSQFVKMFELGSDIPTVSDEPYIPPKDKKIPLNLKVRMNQQKISVYTGEPAQERKSFNKSGDDYDFKGLHRFLVELKAQHKDENTVILEPANNLDYQLIISLMDAVRQFHFDDPSLTVVDEEGNEAVVPDLFSDIIFGNLED